jgi:hypothetical protein
MASDLTPERIALNQIAFRQANEQIEAAADRMGLIGRVPFICECADPSCTEIVRLSNEAYEEVRQHPRRFFTAPGHQTIAVEAGAATLVEEHKTNVIVEKIGVAGEIAEQDHNRTWSEREP